MADGTIRSANLPPKLDERYVEYRDENGMSSSEALRSLVREGLEAEENKAGLDQREVRGGGGGFLSRLIQSVAAFAIVALIVVASVGLKVNLALPGVSVATVILMAVGADKDFDKKYESMRAGAAERVAEYTDTNDHGLYSKAITRVRRIGGACQAGWAKVKEDHPAPSNPTGIVGRLAWADLYAHLVLALSFIATIPLLIVHYIAPVSTEAVVALLGVTGTLLYLTFVVFLLYLWGFLYMIASLAQIALATAAEPGEDDAPAVEEAET